MSRDFLKYTGWGILSVIFGFYTANAKPCNNADEKIKTEKKINDDLETRITKNESENKRECSFSVVYGYINNLTSSRSADFYFMSPKDIGFGINVTQYEKDIYDMQYCIATERMVQLDASVIYRLNPNVSAEIGIRRLQSDYNSDSGPKLGMRIKIPLNEKIKFNLNSDVSFLKDKTQTEIYGGVDFDVTSNLSITGGYNNLSSSSESLSGPFLGLKYNF
ncbi:hypothetical protein JW949_04665 [Candidatus Woesearchaeota archaeon]|nr:hypothetical protein [Candidatus Woesearchaeota archaeon]